MEKPTSDLAKLQKPIEEEPLQARYVMTMKDGTLLMVTAPEGADFELPIDLKPRCPSFNSFMFTILDQFIRSVSLSTYDDELPNDPRDQI